jgi:two-component system chemotaxis response regulator CheB
VAVAASTGGPAALQRILAALPRDFAAPILVVQHMARGFVEGVATWLGASCDLRVKVATHGEPLLGRTVFLAPDDRHLGVGPDGLLLLADAQPVGGFRPSGTYLFRSAAQAYGASLAAVILSGMGSDGVEGLKAVKAAGGLVLAQDEASSVVFGMPGEAVAAGVVDAVLAVEQIGPRLAELVAGGNDADARPRR